MKTIETISAGGGRGLQTARATLRDFEAFRDEAGYGPQPKAKAAPVLRRPAAAGEGDAADEEDADAVEAEDAEEEEEEEEDGVE